MNPWLGMVVDALKSAMLAYFSPGESRYQCRNLSRNFAEGGRAAVINRRDFRNDFNGECASRIS